jgi:hypothetical protein
MGEDTELPIDTGQHSHSGSGSDTLLKERKKTAKSSDQGRHVLTHQGADSLSSDVAVNLIISGVPPGNQKYKIGKLLHCLCRRTTRPGRAHHDR